MVLVALCGIGICGWLGREPLLEGAASFWIVSDPLTRADAIVEDYFHLVLDYAPLRVILHAGTLVPHPGPRFTVHGDGGSFLKYGRQSRAVS